MRYKLLGRSGLRVSELCLGAMTFGEDWGWGAPKEECKKIFDAFVEAGGNSIDTANYYTNGTSEKRRSCLPRSTPSTRARRTRTVGAATGRTLSSRSTRA